MEQMTVKLETLERMVHMLKKQKINNVSFEFLVGSCFPHVMDNIKEEMKRQHALGFSEGLKRGDSNDD